MSEGETFQTIERTNNSMTIPFYGMIEEVRVMLIDTDKALTTKMVNLLQSYDYKVVTVDTMSAAMSMLSKEKVKIDVMVVNIYSPNRISFQLLEQAASMNIVSFFVCDEHDIFLAKKVLENGAYLYMKKPLDEDIMKYLWQFVLREKVQRERARKILDAHGDQMNVDVINHNDIVGDDEQAGEKNMPISNDEQSKNILKVENNVVSNRKYKPRRKRGRKNTNKINEGEIKCSAISKIVRQKKCIEWTVDLHAKFMKAIDQLGDGGCLPKEILEAMNVPGLTRPQVASHLQKCRINNWKPKEERKYIRQGSSSGSQGRRSYNISIERKKRSSCKKFGRMPRLQTNVPNQSHRGTEFSLINANNIFSSSTQQQLHHPQLQVQPQYLNPFLSTQNDAAGGLQQQHGPLFEMLGSENPIGSTTYRSGLAFNSGDYHDYSLDHQNQNDYNLNLNAAHVTTYSGSAIMSDIHVGNVITNELGAENSNFQQYNGEHNVFDTSNIVATSDANDIEGSDSNEWEDCDIYLNLTNMDDLFQNHGSPSAST